MELNDFVPWEKYPELTAERLAIIASLIADAREGAVRRHVPAEGDGAWSLGCVAYERTFFALKQGSAKHNWLTVTPDPIKPLRFAFAVGHVVSHVFGYA